MNIFVNFLLYLVVFSILYVIMEAEPKIFLNLFQFISIILQQYYYDVIVYYVTSLYLPLHLSFLYLHLNALAPRFGIIYSSWSRKDWSPRTRQNPAWRCIFFLWCSSAMTWQKSRKGGYNSLYKYFVRMSNLVQNIYVTFMLQL